MLIGEEFFDEIQSKKLRGEDAKEEFFRELLDRLKGVDIHDRINGYEKELRLNIAIPRSF